MVGQLFLFFFLQHNYELEFAGKDNIEIAFMYSQCGEDWKQVKIEKDHMIV